MELTIDQRTELAQYMKTGTITNATLKDHLRANHFQGYSKMTHDELLEKVWNMCCESKNQNTLVEVKKEVAPVIDEDNAVLSIDVGIKNLALCCLQKKGDVFTILGWFHVNLLASDAYKGETEEYKVREAIECLPTELNVVLSKLTFFPKQVIIENQPRTNPSMRVMAGAIHSFFKTTAHERKLPLKFTYVQAKGSMMKNLLSYCGDDAQVKKEWERYKERKECSVMLTKHILDNEMHDIKHSFFLDVIDKKKDDLCDAFLHAKAWLTHKSEDVPKKKKKRKVATKKTTTKKTK